MSVDEKSKPPRLHSTKSNDGMTDQIFYCQFESIDDAIPQNASTVPVNLQQANYSFMYVNIAIMDEQGIELGNWERK